MVKQRMDLLELLRKRGMDGDVDLLREALRVLVDGIMDAEVSAQIGAQHGERSPERVTYRNGYRNRTWDTRVGTMELHIPKLREGSYFPSLLEPRRRSEKALLAVIQQAYVEGVSTRRVDDLIKALGCDGISSSQVSRICEQLDEVVESFLGRPLDSGPYPYVWLDGLTQKVREGGRIVNVCVVVATGIHTSKPQLFVDTIFIPKRKRLASHKRQSKQTKSAPRQKPAPPTPKHRPSKRKKPALTRQERKEQGLCRCGQAAIQGQTRCAECAEKHREWHRQDSENRRRAKGIKPRPRIGAELIEQIQKETADQKTRGASQTPKRVRSEEYKKKNQQHRAQVRAERKSLGLCVQCAEPSPAGRTRCPDCVLKHRQTGLRSIVKAKLTAEQ